MWHKDTYIHIVTFYVFQTTAAWKEPPVKMDVSPDTEAAKAKKRKPTESTEVRNDFSELRKYENCLKRTYCKISHQTFLLSEMIW